MLTDLIEKPQPDEDDLKRAFGGAARYDVKLRHLVVTMKRDPSLVRENAAATAQEVAQPGRRGHRLGEGRAHGRERLGRQPLQGPQRGAYEDLEGHEGADRVAGQREHRGAVVAVMVQRKLSREAIAVEQADQFTARAELRRRRLLTFLRDDQPAWNESDHPELGAGSGAWVKRIRSESEKRIPAPNASKVRKRTK